MRYCQNNAFANRKQTQDDYAGDYAVSQAHQVPAFRGA